MMDKLTLIKSTSEFRKIFPSEYHIAQRLGLLPRLCEKYNWKIRVFWTIEMCIAEAKKYNTKGEWRINSASSYSIACKKGWLKECCSHMVLVKTWGKWSTKEACLTEALKHNTRTDFSDNCPTAYAKCLKEKWLDEVCSHMTLPIIPQGHWVCKENCLTEAKKHKTKSEWQDNSSASYNQARERGWLEECSEHMTSPYKPRGFWTKEKCVKEARKYKTTMEWRKYSMASFAAAYRYKWNSFCTEHMNNKKPTDIGQRKVYRGCLQMS